MLRLFRHMRLPLRAFPLLSSLRAQRGQGIFNIIYRPQVFRAVKIMMMAVAVIILLTACNANETENMNQAPLADSGTGPTASAEQYSQCWQTGVIDTLYSLMGTVALTTYEKMTAGALAFMMVAFAIWMSYRLILQLSSFTEETMGEVWTEIIKRFFLCFVCGLIASQTGLLVLVLADFIFPIYNAFLEFASQLMAVSVPNDVTTHLQRSIHLFNYDITLLNIDMDMGHSSSNPLQCTASAIEFSKDATNFPDSPRQMMDCMVCAVSHSLSFGIQVGFEIMQLPGVTGWCVGLLTLITFMCVKLSFVFYLVDTIFRFTVMVVMLPLMIMAFAFPKTRGLLSRGIANMLNSAAFMMFFALIISVCVQAISVILESFKGVFTMDATGSVPFKDFSVPFICILMIGFLVFSSVKIAGQLCDSLVGGKSNSEFQQSAKALIVGAFKWIGSMGLKVASIALPKNAKEWLDNKMNKALSVAKKVTGDDEK